MSILRSVTTLMLGTFLAGCCSIFPDLDSCRPPPVANLKLENYAHHNGAGTAQDFEVLNNGIPLQAIGRQAIYAVRTKEESTSTRTQRLLRQDGYLAARLQIERVAGEATNATDPSSVDRLFAGVWKESQEYAALVSVYNTSNPSDALVLPVVQSSRASNQAANPTANSGIFVMRPSLIGPSDQYTIKTQFSWGDGVDQKIAGLALDAMKTAAGMVVGIPAPLAVGLAGITKDDRDRANKVISEALTTKVNAQPVSYTLSQNQINDGRALLVVIFDRDTREVTDMQNQTLLRYRIDFAPMLSILTSDTKIDSSTNHVLPDFSRIRTDVYYMPFVRSQPNETPRALVQRQNLSDQSSDWREYHRLCTDVAGIFSSKGFNADDTQAFRWAALSYARQRLPVSIADSDGRTPCPDSEMPMPSFNPPARRVP